MPLRRRSCLAFAAAPLLGPAVANAQGILDVTLAELEAMRLQPDGITLEFPPMADTSFSVPLRADIVAPPGLAVQAIEVFLPGNPSTRAMKLRLAQPQPRYAFSTRVRLARSQEAWVVVTFSDGSKRGAHAPTVVTSSACFDAS